MANEFKHKDPCTTLTQAEYIGACGDGHVFASQDTGDLLYADSATVLKRLEKGSTTQMLQIASCKPAWTSTPSLGTTSWANMNHAHAASNSGGTVNANCLGGSTLKSCVVSSSLTSLGTLCSIDINGGAVDGVTIGTNSAVTELQVDYINANASTLTITDSSDTGDLASLAVTTHGATTLTTTDDDAAAAHFTVDADGNITLDSATGIVTIEDAGVERLRFTESCSGDVTIKLVTNGKDLIFTDNGDAEGFRILDAAAGVNVAGLLTAGSLDIDNVLINGTTIGHTCDTDLMTVGNACLTIKGDVTVGVDDTGHDVKFFGAAAGAYMLYDQSEDQLEIRGASADATTSTGKLLLSTSLTNVNANDVIGSINFQAPAEAGGTDAIAIAAGIRAVAQATFTCAVNSTDLIFYTGHSEAATEKFRFTSQGEIGIGGANYGTDGQVLTSGGAGAAAAWEDAGGGGAVAREGGNLTEATTTSTGTADLLAATSLTVAGAQPLHYIYDFRKTSGASAQVIQGVKLNCTAIFNQSSGSLGATDANNEAESGTFNIFIAPSVSCYTYGLLTGTMSTYATNTRRNDITAPCGATVAAIPTAEVTTLTAQSKLSSASITGGFDELNVYSMVNS